MIVRGDVGVRGDVSVVMMGDVCWCGGDVSLGVRCDVY